MFRMKNDDSIKSALRGKAVAIIDGDATFCQVKLLENAGAHKTGDTLSSFRVQIEEVDDVTGTIRSYNPELAEALDERLNKPYEPTNMPCPNANCDNDSGFDYVLTGHVQDDGSGIYVEKACAKCGTFTTDGDGDFHSYYRIENGDILDIEDTTPVTTRSTDAVDAKLFALYDADNGTELEKELYNLVDAYNQKFNAPMSDEQRDEVVARTLKGIDADSLSIEACLSGNIRAIDDSN